MVNSKTLTWWIISAVLAIFAGWLCRTAINMSSLLFIFVAFVIFCCAVAFPSTQFDKVDAKNRTPSNPKTSFDQESNFYAATFVMIIFAIIGFIIG